MGAQNGKEKARFENVGEQEVEKMGELFKKYGGGGGQKGKLDRQQFEAAFPILRPICDQFYENISRKETDHKVHLNTLLKCCDSALGTYDEQAEVLRTVMGEDTPEIVRNLVAVYAKSHSWMKNDEEKLGEHLDDLNTYPVGKLEKFLMECPLLVKLNQFVFRSILSLATKPLLPAITGGDSGILTTSDIIVLNSHLAMDQKKKWELLFASSTMGASFSQMIRRINKEGPCLVIIQSQSLKIFGFYASDGFVSGPLYHGNEQCFLFELHPHIRTYASTGREQSYVYLNYQQQSMPNGLGIGGHGDVWPLFIHEEYGTGICQKDSSAFERCFIAGEKNFKIKNMEVWRVGEKAVLRDEDGEIIPPKKDKSIIDKDPQAAAVLAMAGRPMYSEAYREPAPLLDDDDDN